ncbi:DUF1801 domain-containing protein [Galbibacter sp. BG1]|uniref:DUF1801 domain-containing protein n=1 Tax=Galbibacter sp. BG1 TaxID=1170699 RepID=UPI0015BBD795|nr:DUF1801 domain-containing protein [Galbibacter sp. BG1]QLE00374.1 DUF1801 domain-containing protein [Galbibacter sp. BG1]
MSPADKYILDQPEKFRIILMHLQLIVENTKEDLDLKYKWHLPFYYYKAKPFCYFNVTHGYVDLCFMKGMQLTKHTNHLVGKDRKLVKSLRFWSVDDIDDTIVLEVIEELKALY